MNVVTLKAHFDGEKICLVEPFDLAVNTALLVSVLKPDEREDPERTEWVALAKKALSLSCGDDEPDYPSDLARERPSE